MTSEQREMVDHLWVSPRRFAAMSGIPVSTIYRWVRQGRIRSGRRDGRRLWLEVGEAAALAKSAPGGVVPSRYRDEFGRPLEGVECPRSELVFGTAAANVERAAAVAQIDLAVLPDQLLLRDAQAPDQAVLPEVLVRATETVDDPERGVRHVLLY